MRMVWAKLGFAHRFLWARDQTYCLAFVLGPPVLLATFVAGLAWSWTMRPTQAPWAKPQLFVDLPQDGPPVAIAPFAPLPPIGLDGSYRGLEPGWSGGIQRLEILPTLATNLLTSKLADLSMPPGPIDVNRIIAASPSAGLFDGVLSGLLTIREAGRYQLGTRLHRSSFQVADCDVRLGFGGRRILSNRSMNLEGESNVTFDPVTFDLRAGLYHLSVAFGCWHDGHMQGPGELTLLLKRPGDRTMTPIGGQEIWRPFAGAK